jgi:hypothetical protein
MHHWQEYGVLWRDDLNSNRNVFMEVDDIIRSNAGKEIYVAPMLAPLAIKKHLAYIDNGHRMYFIEYINARRNGTFAPSPLLSWLAARKPGGSERASFEDVLERSDVVICILGCPNEETHQFVRNLGLLISAYNQRMVVELYYSKKILVDK